MIWTPGPWRIDPKTLTICRLIISTEDVNTDAIVTDKTTICYVPTDYNEAEQHANAQLISAAPELYRALNQIAKGRLNELAVKEALRKARGVK